MLKPLKSRNFRLFWLGESASLLGDQFFLIALPWLVLKLSGDAFAVGAVLAVAGIPRAMFILLGGALTDRFSARSMMLWSNVVRMLLVSFLAAIVLLGSVELWMLYVLALVFGIADAFFFPAQAAITPTLVPPEQLLEANSLVMGTAHLSLMVGPAAAGLVIALLAGTSDPTGMEDVFGIGVAFAVDGLTFLVSAVTLWLMKVPQLPEVTDKAIGVFRSIGIGLSGIWGEPKVRAVFMMIAMIHLVGTGPFAVGIPVLADTRFPQGATALGIIVSAEGGGALLATLLVGLLPKMPQRYLGWLLPLATIPFGIGLILYAYAGTMMEAAVIAFCIGASFGFVGIQFTTWLQQQIPKPLMGRTMSLVMFAGMGMAPISSALAGVLIDVSIVGLFVGAGVVMVIANILALFHAPLRNLGVPSE